MSSETTIYLSREEFEQVKARARQMQAEAIRTGLRAVLHWIAHPSLHLRHA